MEWNWVDVLIAVATAGTFLVAAVALVVSILAFIRAGEANKIAHDQESGQREKRDKLLKGLEQCSSKLSEMTSRLTPHQIDTSPPRVAQELDEIRDDLPDLEELKKAAAGVRDRGVREKAVSGLGSAEEWRFAVDHAWRLVKDLPGWSIETRDRRDEVLGNFAVARYELHMKHEELRTPILEAIEAINAADRREVPKESTKPAPRWKFWKRWTS